MLNIKRILVPIDFSESSPAVLRYAADMADALSAELVVLHARWEPKTYVALDIMVTSHARGEPSREQSRVAAMVKLYGLTAETIPNFDGTIEHVVEASDAAPAILECIDAYSADLVIMGTQGRQGLDRWVMGSVAESVVRKAVCPVITLRSSSGEQPQQDAA